MLVFRTYVTIAMSASGQLNTSTSLYQVLEIASSARASFENTRNSYLVPDDIRDTIAKLQAIFDSFLRMFSPKPEHVSFIQSGDTVTVKRILDSVLLCTTIVEKLEEPVGEVRVPISIFQRTREQDRQTSIRRIQKELDAQIIILPINILVLQLWVYQLRCTIES